jgi:hypothetical protein
MQQPFQHIKKVILLLIAMQILNNGLFAQDVLYNSGEAAIIHSVTDYIAKNIFHKTSSRLALVTIVTDCKLTSNCIGYVEEFLEHNHINEYLKNKLINQETYNKLKQFMTSNIVELENNEENIFETDDNKDTSKLESLVEECDVDKI